jgi:hypothetical protein
MILTCFVNSLVLGSRSTFLTLTVPTGWHFVEKPYVNPVKDDQDAFKWNNFEKAHDRFFVTQKNSNYIVATCWTGSRAIIINLACLAEQD